MNDARFKELLNLHLDHRLSAEEARELEQTLHADPARRREFRTYALLERGCAELFRRSASDAPAPDALVRALRDAEARMSAKSERRLLVWGWGTWGATAGMAAMVVLVVARVSQPVHVAGTEQKAAYASSASAPTSLAAGPAASYASARTSLPAHLTLAALGIEASQSEAGSSLSRWQLVEDQQMARMDGHGSSWMTASVAALNEWNGVNTSSVPPEQFSRRPINAWGTQSGYQTQTAAYTFER